MTMSNYLIDMIIMIILNQFNFPLKGQGHVKKTCFVCIFVNIVHFLTDTFTFIPN